MPFSKLTENWLLIYITVFSNAGSTCKAWPFYWALYPHSTLIIDSENNMQFTVWNKHILMKQKHGRRTQSKGFTRSRKNCLNNTLIFSICESRWWRNYFDVLPVGFRQKIKNMYFVNHDNLVPTFLDKPYKTCLLCSIASDILQNKFFFINITTN